MRSDLHTRQRGCSGSGTLSATLFSLQSRRGRDKLLLQRQQQARVRSCKESQKYGCISEPGAELGVFFQNSGQQRGIVPQPSLSGYSHSIVSRLLGSKHTFPQYFTHATVTSRVRLHADLHQFYFCTSCISWIMKVKLSRSFHFEKKNILTGFHCVAKAGL